MNGKKYRMSGKTTIKPDKCFARLLRKNYCVADFWYQTCGRKK